MYVAEIFQATIFFFILVILQLVLTFIYTRVVVILPLLVLLTW